MADGVGTGPDDGRKPRICVLLNVRSGRRGRAARAAIDAAMARHPGRFVLRTIDKGGDVARAAEEAVSDGFPVLVAAGGDGTICTIASVAQAAGRTLGLVPMGTFNFFARSLGLPDSVDAAMDLIAAGPTRDVVVGDVNGALFLNNASLGLYPAILAQREGTYRRWGRSRLAAHWSVIVTFTKFHRPLALRVSIDGREVRRRTPIAFVARSAFQLDHFGLVGAEDVRDGRFGVFLVPDAGRVALFRFAARLMLGVAERGRDYEYFAGRAVDIETRSARRLVARDGERGRMASPFRFRMRKAPLVVIAPAEG